MSSILLRRVHAGGGFVEQQQLRFRGQGAHDLQAALVAVGQALGRLVAQARQVEDLQQLHGLRGDLPLPRRGKRGRRISELSECVLAGAGDTATRTLSNTLRDWNRRMFWKVRAMPSRVICYGLRPTQRLPGEADVAGGRADRRR